MRYVKPALSFEEQADLLLERGLIAQRNELIERLKSVNYYRLSGYLYPFKLSDNTYRAGTTLEEVWRSYTFDRRLRLLVLDGIERVEVAIRTQTVYEHVHRYGPFGYANPSTLPKLSGQRFGKFIAQLDREVERSHERFVEHFKSQYGDDHRYLPLWMAAEIMPFGTTLTLYRGVADDISKAVGAIFGQPNEVFESWLLALNTVRNICAHHSRLWNRTLGVPPKIPRSKKHPDWHTPSSFRNNKAYAVLTILRYLLTITAPQSQWPDRLRALLAEYPEVSTKAMGFPDGWEECPIWLQVEPPMHSDGHR